MEKEIKVYSENPCKLNGVINSSGVRNGKRFEAADINSGEIRTFMTLGSYNNDKIDSLNYVKCYFGVFGVLPLLSRGGLVLFCFICRELKIKRDYIDIDIDYCIGACKIKDRGNYHRAIKELMEYNILFRSNIRNRYFINVNLFYNGKRKL